MSRPGLSVSQIFGLALLMMTGAYGLVAFLKLVLDDSAFSYITGDDLTNTLPLLVLVIVFAGAAIVAIISLIALVSRSGTMARVVGGMVLALVILGAVGEVWLAQRVNARLSRYSIGYGDTLNTNWAGHSWYYLAMLVVLLAVGLLCMIGTPQRRTSSPIEFGTPVTPPPLPATVLSAPAATFFVQVDAVEYGPYTDADISSFVRQGRVTPNTLIRPRDGFYEPAAHVPGLFPG